ncbi:MAG TPA: hypothetical protein V6C72_02070, partial [Chroococcales cyanobacterium]
PEQPLPPSGPVDVQGYGNGISGRFPDYWSYRYPNGNVPSWDSTYGGAQGPSPLDNSGQIHYSQSYRVNPQSYSASGAPGFYNQYSWQQNGPNGGYGGSTPFRLPQAELDYAARRNGYTNGYTGE